MDDALINADRLSKVYCRDLRRSLRYGLSDIAREILSARPRRGVRDSEFYSVSDLSFAVKRGECLGVIGPNGAGKSTLLKLLTGLVKPNSGQVRVRGRVGALIDLGTGFSPVLTARENVFINAALHGMDRREVLRRFDDIIGFAEIEGFVDTPLSSFSSGMKVRLGFAIAAHLKPDVLLIDEVLAVGDVGFRAKCYNAIQELKRTAAVLFVSHSMSQIARLADRTLVLGRGIADFLGPTDEGIERYHALCNIDEHTRAGSGEARIERLQLIGPEGHAGDAFQFGAPLIVHLRVMADTRLDAIVVDINFHNAAGEFVAQCNNYVTPVRIELPAHVQQVITLEVDRLMLNPGRYRVDALLMSEDMTRHYDWIRGAAELVVVGARPARAGMQLTPTVRVSPATAGDAGDRNELELAATAPPKRF